MSVRDEALVREAADEVRIVAALLLTLDGAATPPRAKRRKQLMHAATLAALAAAYRQRARSVDRAEIDALVRDLAVVAIEIVTDGRG